MWPALAKTNGDLALGGRNGHRTGDKWAHVGTPVWRPCGSDLAGSGDWLADPPWFSGIAHALQILVVLFFIQG